MTGKQAAQTAKEAAKRSWETVSARSAAIFVVGGIAAIAAGRYIEGADWATVYGWLMGGWGVLQSVVERSAKRTGSEVTNQVWEKFGEHKALIEKGNDDHDACEAQHVETRNEIRQLRSDVNEIATAVESVKPGWKFGMGS